MSIEQISKIDFASVDKASGDIWLTISDHLPWNENEGAHLSLLQAKLNAYLDFIESGEIEEKIPDAKGRSAVINIVGKFPLSEQAKVFFNLSSAAITAAGHKLQFNLMKLS